MDLRAIVIDNGSGLSCKVGFAGECVPQAIIPSVVGRPRRCGTSKFGSIKQKEIYIGEHAQTKRSFLNVRKPIENGLIIHWEDMEALWHYSFQTELRIVPDETNILLTEAPLNPRCNREKMTEIMFESFGFNGIYLINHCVSSLLASNRNTGVVLDVGDNGSYVVPVYEGHALQHAITKLDFGGRAVTDNLHKILAEQHANVAGIERDSFRAIKEQCAYVAVDYSNECTKLLAKKTFTLPDGDRVDIDSERIRCSEVLFDPSLIGMKSMGIHEAVVRAISNCDKDIHSELFSNVVLAGGPTMSPGFAERMQRELLLFTRMQKKVKVYAPRKRHISAWKGGSIVGKEEFFSQMCITRDLYQEFGPEVVNMMCF